MGVCYARDMHAATAPSLNRLAFSATAHCLTGCAIGEVLGMVIGTALGWSDWPTIALAVVLAFIFGYSFTLVPLVRGGLVLAAALPIAFAADTISITIMEIVDNAIMLLIPGRWRRASRTCSSGEVSRSRSRSPARWRFP